MIYFGYQTLYQKRWSEREGKKGLVNNLSLACINGYILPPVLMRETTLCQSIRVQILLIFKKHFVMMTVVIGLQYFEYALNYRNTEIWSNG